MTGAGSGIGAAMCRRFGAEGMEVIAADIDLDAAEATAAEAGGHARYVDVSDPTSVVALADESFRVVRSRRPPVQQRRGVPGWSGLGADERRLGLDARRQPHGHRPRDRQLRAPHGRPGHRRATS